MGQIHFQAVIVSLGIALLSCGHFDRVRIGPVSLPMDQPQPLPPMPFHDLTATDINGQIYKFDQLRGHKVIVVNTASECGYTPQYAQLQELYELYTDKGLLIIGFPSNDFGKQEPGTEDEIATFCQKNFGVTFPMMAKVNTKGENQHAVYNWLTNKELNGVLDSEVKWNFHKYLIDAEGRLVMSLGSAITPLDEEILEWLDK